MNKVTKRGWIAGLALVLGLGFTTTSVAQDVFFSEYIEGSSNNKALEIYNPSADTVFLSGYAFPNVSNGPTTPGVHEHWNTFPDTAFIAPGGVYVIVHPDADSVMKSQADMLFQYLSNGDDGFALVKGSEDDYTVIDWLGDFQADPGTGWPVAGVADGTVNKTLVRKPGSSANSVALASFGTNADDSEWIVYDQDTFTYLGSHDNAIKYDVTFQVDMNDAINKQNFVPGTHAVVLAGDFNDWNPRRDTLRDANKDGIYDITIPIADGTYNWKFTYSSRQFQPLEWDADPARSLTVAGEDVDTGVLTPNVTFDDLADATFDKVAVQFQVNMEVQILKGAFNPDVDIVDVRGNFNGWAAGTPLTEGSTPNVFETVVYFDDYRLGGSFVYKFTTTIAGQTNWESPNNENPDNNRISAVLEAREYTAEERTEDGYIAFAMNLDGEAPFFSDITSEDIFTSASEVTFKVDLRPAFYFLADSAGLPRDVQTQDTTSAIRGLFANGPLLAGTWETWGEDRLGTMDDLRLYDDGTNGDETANDSIYTRTFAFAAGADRVGPYKFGINGLDNEAFAGDNHRARIENGQVVENVFGAIVQTSGNVLDGVYDPYILIGEDNVLTVVRRGGQVDFGETSISEIETDLPKDFALNQNYPNPFNPSTTIGFQISKAANVNLTIYNVLGQKVATLISNQMMSAGSYNYNFDASRLASGMYIYHLQAGSFSATKSMTLIK